MKKFKLLIIAIIALISVQQAHAQSDKSQRTVGIKTQTFKVLGTCDMDKRRIENAAFAVDGIKSATWNLNKQSLTISYNIFKNDVADNVQRKVASEGNDTERYKADDIAYNNLPECCHYRKS